MLSNVEIKEFITFLKKEHSYGEFLYEEHKNTPARAEMYERLPINPLLSTVQRNNIKDLIISAFDWSATKKGPKFWGDMHIKWIAYLKEQILSKYFGNSNCINL